MGSPCPCFEVRPTPPRRRRLADTVIELSRDCMTRPMMVRSLQCRTEVERRKVAGCRAASARKRSGVTRRRRREISKIVEAMDPHRRDDVIAGLHEFATAAGESPVASAEWLA